jgi:ABC-type branched-subunit amino acid transport system substrate-binding protein
MTAGGESVSKSLKLLMKVSFIVVLLALLVTGCSSQPKILKIGAFYPMTGANAAKGGLNKNGTELAVKDINAAG